MELLRSIGLPVRNLWFSDLLETSIGYSFTFTVPAYTVMQENSQIASGIMTVPFTVTGLLTYGSGAKLQTTGMGT